MASPSPTFPADKFPPLRLPAAPLKLRHTSAGFEVFDFGRRRWIILTPEEWVRQHFVAMLIQVLSYPVSAIANEVGIRHNGLHHRCDTIVYGPDRRPWMIVEYKAPTIQITSATFHQIARYNLIARAPFLVVTNGLTHYLCAVHPHTGSVTPLPALPPYGQPHP